MRMQALAFWLAAAVALPAADAPYVARWKMNPARSDFGQSTVTFTQLASGEMESTAEGQSYKFKLDGKEYPDPYGNTAAWKSIDAKTWETTWKLKGKVLTVDSVKLSPDGSALTINSKGTKPNGEAINDTITFQRVSGGPGLPGKWKTKNLNSSSPNTIEIATSAPDGIIYKVVDMNMTCNAKFDGKFYPCTGPTMGPGWTVSWTKSGATGLAYTVQVNGKPMYKGSMTVSADGKTLTDAGIGVVSNEKMTIVYDRQ